MLSFIFKISDMFEAYFSLMFLSTTRNTITTARDAYKSTENYDCKYKDHNLVVFISEILKIKMKHFYPIIVCTYITFDGLLSKNFVL